MRAGLAPIRLELVPARLDQAMGLLALLNRVLGQRGEAGRQRLARGCVVAPGEEERRLGAAGADRAEEEALQGGVQFLPRG